MSRTIKTLVLCLTAFGWGCAGEKVTAPIDDSIDPGMMGDPEVRSPDDMLKSRLALRPRTLRRPPRSTVMSAFSMALLGSRSSLRSVGLRPWPWRQAAAR